MADDPLPPEDAEFVPGSGVKDLDRNVTLDGKPLQRTIDEVAEPDIVATPEEAEGDVAIPVTDTPEGEDPAGPAPDVKTAEEPMPEIGPDGATIAEPPLPETVPPVSDIPLPVTESPLDPPLGPSTPPPPPATEVAGEGPGPLGLSSAQATPAMPSELTPSEAPSPPPTPTSRQDPLPDSTPDTRPTPGDIPPEEISTPIPEPPAQSQTHEADSAAPPIPAPPSVELPPSSPEPADDTPVFSPELTDDTPVFSPEKPEEIAPESPPPSEPSPLPDSAVSEIEPPETPDIPEEDPDHSPPEPLAPPDEPTEIPEAPIAIPTFELIDEHLEQPPQPEDPIFDPFDPRKFKPGSDAEVVSVKGDPEPQPEPPGDQTHPFYETDFSKLDAADDSESERKAFGKAITDSMADRTFAGIDQKKPGRNAFYVGYDKNGHLVVFFLAPMDAILQLDLAALREDIPLLDIPASDLGYDRDSHMGALLIPIYNGAPENVACCVPKYTELKFVTSIGGLDNTTWACAQWVGNQYLAMDASGEHSLRVFYDKCGRGWTGVVEPENMLSMGSNEGHSGDMTSTLSPVGNWTFTGGGVTPEGENDSAANVATALAADLHPCNADLIAFESLVSLSTSLNIYACD